MKIWNYIRKTAPWMLVGAIACTAPAVAQNVAREVAFYVAPTGDDGASGARQAPFRTLERARDAVRAANSQMGDISVFLRGGQYHLTQPLRLSAVDSGKNGHVVWRAFQNEEPVLSGGRRISGWTPVGDGTYRAAAGDLRFRQLYINNRRAKRARSLGTASDYPRSLGWEVRAGVVNIKLRLSDVPQAARNARGGGSDAVELHVLRHWSPAILRVAALETDGENAYVSFQQPEAARLLRTFKGVLHQPNQSIRWEGAREFLDEPGEWWQNARNGEVIYRPRAGERMESAEVVAPVLESLLEIQGTPAAPVSDVSFQGLTWQHSTWLLPSRDGYVAGQASNYVTENWSQYNPGALQVSYGKGLRFEGNVLRGLGADGLVLLAGTSGCEIVGNAVSDIAGTGIRVGDFTNKSPQSPAIARGDLVAHNFVTRVGRDYAGAVGIAAGYTDGIRIENNEVWETPYTGINVGWGWTDNTTGLKNNLIRRNHIHHVVQLLDDGGGIYTLSRQTGTQILENYIHDIHRSPYAQTYPIAAIYLDNFSSFIRVEKNVLERVPDGSPEWDKEKRSFLHRPWKAQRIFQQVIPLKEAHDNTLANNDGDAQSVKEQAGPSAAYRPMRQRIENQ